MATHFPRDRFDSLPAELDRVGAHRAPARSGSGWIGFAWSALATGLLVAAGVIGLSVFTDSLSFDLPFTAPDAAASDTPADTAAPTAEPALDPAIPITVLNGTPTTGLAGTVGDLLVTEGWGGAAIGVGSRSSAATQDVATTAVFYSDPVNEAAARALVQSLGVGEVRLGDDYPNSPMTVVLGADYVPPAG
ncbi:MAG: hypothetical protein RI885_649 [Actinomycetota bacterium]|jgi:hypothetical protein